MSDAIADPLGLTPEQRQKSDENALMEGFLERVRHNLEAIDALPNGTFIHDPMSGLTIPIEAVR